MFKNEVIFEDDFPLLKDLSRKDDDDSSSSSDNENDELELMAAHIVQDRKVDTTAKLWEFNEDDYNKPDEVAEYKCPLSPVELEDTLLDRI